MKVGLLFFALGSLLFGIVFITSGVVPPALGWMGAVASGVSAVGILVALAVPEAPPALMSGILVVMVHEIVLGF